MTPRTFTLPLSVELLEWLEDWIPPYVDADGPPLAIPEKIVLAVVLAQIFDGRQGGDDRVQ